MPTLALTINQAFRYFLAGAFFLFVARLLGQPLETTIHLTRLESGAILFVLALVVGTVAYCLHRIVVNPLLLRPIICLLYWNRVKKESLWWLPWWPLNIEAELTARRIADTGSLSYLLGWSSELNFLYVAIELSYFALWWWPGAATQNRWLYSVVAAVVLLLTWLWSLTAAKAEESVHPLPRPHGGHSS